MSRPQGGHRKGEKLGPGTFATLERRGLQGRAHISVVFSCKGAERDEWRGPEGPIRSIGSGSFVKERELSGEARRVASDQNAKF